MRIAQIKFEDIILPTSGPSAININKSDFKIGDVVGAILPYVFAASGILLLLYLLLGGFQLMFSAGDPKKIQGAWGKITNAVIGFFIIFLAYWLTQLFGKILNIQIIGNIFK